MPSTIQRVAPAPTVSDSVHPNTAMRLGVLIIVFALEDLFQFPHPWLPAHQPMTAPIVFAAALFFFARPKLHALRFDDDAINPSLVILHVLFLAVLLCDFRFLHPAGLPPRALSALAIAYIFILFAPITLALFPLRTLLPWLRSLGLAWLYATLITAATMAARNFVRLSWDATDSRFGHAMQRATYAGVRAILCLLYPTVISDTTTAILGTPRFRVKIASSCSGIEGLALMLIFTLGWLFFTRRELRLERALWLIPIALATGWLLNLVRIATLICIGDRGHLGVALDGFHTDAGWLLFNVVAVAFLIAVQQIPALRRQTIP